MQVNLNKYIYNLTQDSDRAGHLTAAVTVGFVIAGLGLHYHNLLLIKAGCFTPVIEYLFTPDHDHNSRRIKGGLFRRLHLLYWAPFKYGVAHRSRWSHSLLFGTPFRTGYVLLPWVVAAIAFYPTQASQLFQMIQSDPIAALEWGTRWDWIPLAMIASDTTHLIKDGFWRKPWEMFLGKGSRRRKRIRR